MSEQLIRCHVPCYLQVMKMCHNYNENSCKVVFSISNSDLLCTPHCTAVDVVWVGVYP